MFRTRLRELRELAGFRSQQAFADAFGVAQSTVGGWEAGKREPNYETTMRLAQYFGVSIDYLLGLEDAKEKPTPENGSGLNAEQAEVVRLYDLASPALQAAALAVLKAAEAGQSTPDGGKEEK